jgi:hypothetical protein
MKVLVDVVVVVVAIVDDEVATDSGEAEVDTCDGT